MYDNSWEPVKGETAKELKILRSCLVGKLEQLVDLATIEIDTDTHRSAPHLVSVHKLLADPERPVPIPLCAQDRVVHVLHYKGFFPANWKRGKGKTNDECSRTYDDCMIWMKEVQQEIARGLPGTEARNLKRVAAVINEIIAVKLVAPSVATYGKSKI
jgi:hypothetical protein